MAQDAVVAVGRVRAGLHRVPARAHVGVDDPDVQIHERRVVRPTIAVQITWLAGARRPRRVIVESARSIEDAAPNA